MNIAEVWKPSICREFDFVSGPFIGDFDSEKHFGRWMCGIGVVKDDERGAVRPEGRVLGCMKLVMGVCIWRVGGYETCLGVGGLEMGSVLMKQTKKGSMKDGLSSIYSS